MKPTRIIKTTSTRFGGGSQSESASSTASASNVFLNYLSKSKQEVQSVLEHSVANTVGAGNVFLSYLSKSKQQVQSVLGYSALIIGGLFIISLVLLATNELALRADTVSKANPAMGGLVVDLFGTFMSVGVTFGTLIALIMLWRWMKGKPMGFDY